MADARAALAVYEYDRARELLERALLHGAGGLEAALPLLELLVDVLGLDVEALALEPKLARAARGDVRVRSRLALAAARTGQAQRALGWLAGLDEPEIVAALLACARQELSGGQLEQGQALLERARRLDPVEPQLAELERSLRDEKRFRVLLLEEELDALVVQGPPEAVEAAARALLARDGRNVKAAQIVERAEVASADALARQLLERVRAEPPVPAELARWVQQLRAAGSARASEALRQVLRQTADDLEARAAEEASRAALAQLMQSLQHTETPAAELVARYQELPDSARRRAREQTGEPLFAWVEALKLRREPARSVLRALEALRKASALEKRDPEAALAVLEPELESLRRLSDATELRARLADAVSRSRRAASAHTLQQAEDALGEGSAQHALELIAKLPRHKLDAALRDRASELTTQAERALARDRLERAVQTHRQQGRLLQARAALDELIASGLLEPEPGARALDLRRTLEAEIRQRFAVEKIPGRLGDWWRPLLIQSIPHANAPAWVSRSSGLAVAPLKMGRWLLLIEISLETGEIAGAIRVHLPKALSVAPDVTLRGTEVTVVSDTAEILVIDLVTGHISTWEDGHAPSDRIIDQCWLSNDPRRLWLELRRPGPDQEGESVRVIDRHSGRIVAEFEDTPQLVRVQGHPEADAIVERRGRPVVVDATGRSLRWKPPEDCSSALVHPRGTGLVLATVDYADTGALTLHELEVGRPPRSVELEGMSGEAQHWVGISRDEALVAVLGYLNHRELWVYRAGEHGLELVWRRACGAGPMLLGDADCQALYVLHARANPGAGWLSRLTDTPIEFDGEPEADLGLARFDGFELWNCTAPDEHHHQRQPPVEGPARNTPSAVLDEFVRRHPGAYRGLRRLWARLDRADASDAELARLVEAHPGSGAVRLFAAHESASDGQWGEARRLLRGFGLSDVDAEDARHLCHLQALCCLLAREHTQARAWIVQGLAHEGSCALENLELAVEPLSPPAGDVLLATLPGAPAELSPVTQLRHLLRELDGLLEADPARLIEHVVFRGSPSVVQVLARRAAAWLCFEPAEPETRARRTLELACFCERLDPLDLAERDLFLPEAWSLEELLALRDRARHALGEATASSQPEAGEAQPSRPPALPHEVAAREVPGFSEQLEDALGRWGTAAGLDAPRVAEAELLAMRDVRNFLAREVRRQTLQRGSRRAARDRARALTALLVASVNYGLCLRKTFWVDAALSAKLRHTQLDIRGAVLMLPFPCCAFVFTEPAVLSRARSLVRLDPGWRETERVAVVTAYLMRSEPGGTSAAGASATLQVCLAISPWGQAVPWVLVRDLQLAPEADLDSILDSHLKDAVERELDPWLGAEELRQLLELTLNAVLYATSAEARPQALPALPRRSSGDPLVLSGEGVFYLPDRIDINEGLPSEEPSGAPQALDGLATGPTIQHRVAVRGHWRRAPPQASDQRLRWVRPHFRGPRHAVLVEREYRLGNKENQR